MSARRAFCILHAALVLSPGVIFGEPGVGLARHSSLVVRVPLEDGKKLCLDLHRRPGHEALVIIPGFWRCRRSPRHRQLGLELAELTSVAVLDMRGHGDSTGTYTFGDKEPSDVGAVLRYLRSLGYTKIGFIGLSMGGYISMETARSHIPDGMEVIGISLVSSPTDIRRARPKFLAPRAIKQLQAGEALNIPRFNVTRVFTHHQNAARSRPASESFPVSIYHCQRDWLIPESEAAEWSKGLGDRATSIVFKDRRGLHADALLATEIPVRGMLASWWRTISKPAHEGN